MLQAEPKIIQSVQRSLDIINCFTETHPVLSLQEISARVHLNINTARGLINTLVYNSVLIHNRSGMYTLGFYFTSKGRIVQQQTKSYIMIAKEQLDAITEKYHISASLQMVNQKQVYSIYCSYPHNAAYSIVLTEYGALPLYATSSGKLLCLYNILPHDENFLKHLNYEPYTAKTVKDAAMFAAQLKKIELQGYSTEEEEFAIGVGSLAVPVLDSERNLVATVSCTVFFNQMEKLRESLLNDLRPIAASIAEVIFA